ncbi:MAG: ECF transporter S component [Agathobacter sp.]|uniref:ECF transporter S component n=1 Tax=Agathobacter sp. TaxID=2021311 RepID=UPI00258A28E7|nr:ECF transporter S component [Agathobacter sp.]MCR5677279.1 ECF transporter S component [Agathobacter sp.]
MDQKNNKKSNVRFMTELALLTAIELIMCFVPGLGYIPIGALKITLLCIPVAVGSVVLGPGAGVFLGFVFGMSSFLDPAKSAMMAVIPVQSFVTAIVPRLFVGLVPGLVFMALRKTRIPRSVSVSIACLLAPLTNTVLYLLFFVIFLRQYMLEINPDVYNFFGNHGFLVCYGWMFALSALNIVLEAVAGLVIGSAICNVLLHTVNKSK